MYAYYFFSLIVNETSFDSVSFPSKRAFYLRQDFDTAVQTITKPIRHETRNFWIGFFLPADVRATNNIIIFPYNFYRQTSILYLHILLAEG